MFVYYKKKIDVYNDLYANIVIDIISKRRKYIYIYP